MTPLSQLRAQELCQHGQILFSGSQDWPGDSEHLRVPTRTANGCVPAPLWPTLQLWGMSLS